MEPIVERFLIVVRDAASSVRAGKTQGLQPEQAFRRTVEAVLPEIFEAWGIAFMPSMERATVTKRRIDMLCGRLVTEYKAPGVLGTGAGYDAALEQSKDYIEQLSVEFAEPLAEYFGIVLDGEHVGFVHHDPEQGWLCSCAPRVERGGRPGCSRTIPGSLQASIGRRENRRSSRAY